MKRVCRVTLADDTIVKVVGISGVRTSNGFLQIYDENGNLMVENQYPPNAWKNIQIKQVPSMKLMELLEQNKDQYANTDVCPICYSAGRGIIPLTKTTNQTTQEITWDCPQTECPFVATQTP